MNSKRRRLLAWILLVLVVLGSGTYYFLTNYVEAKREDEQPPNIIIYSPIDGNTIDADTTLESEVTAAGVHPILRIEMWHNGELSDTYLGDSSGVESSLSLRASFRNVLPEGTHTFYWRAIDNPGLLGQTRIITVIAQPRSMEETEVITADGGQTLQQIAETEGVDMGTMDQLNPDLGPNSLPGGTEIRIPAVSNVGDTSQPPPVTRPNVTGPEPKGHPDVPPNKAPLEEKSDPPLNLGAFFSAVADLSPNRPSSLEAGFENCTIRLVWIDNANDETHFNVWMQRLGGAPQLISVLPNATGTDQVWTEFPAPPFGIYSFWVEAANWLGAQPSEIQGVAVNDANCAIDALASLLEIKALDMLVGGNVSDVHCYISIEEGSSQRIPDFGEMRVADVVKHWGGDTRLLVPFPVDNEISIDGKCLGGDGSPSAATLGEFSARVPATEWDGSRLEVRDGSLIIGYSIQPLGESQVQGIFGYRNTQIPQPRIVDVAAERATDPSDLSELARLGRRPTLIWDWKGPEADITSFTILLDGEILQWAEPDWRSTRILLPDGCGQTYLFQVVANSGDAQSPPSPVFPYSQPPCEYIAEVVFGSIILTDVADGDPGSCDTAETVIFLTVNQEYRVFGGFTSLGGTNINIGCGENVFSTLLSTYPGRRGVGGYYERVFSDVEFGSEATFIVPISPNHPSVHIRAKILDDDFDFDTICDAKVIINNRYQDWPSYVKDFDISCSSNTDEADGEGYVTVIVRGLIAPEGN